MLWSIQQANCSKSAWICTTNSIYLTDISALLIEHSPININKTDKWGRSALMYACVSPEKCSPPVSEEIVKMLIKYGADILAQDLDG